MIQYNQKDLKIDKKETKEEEKYSDILSGKVNKVRKVNAAICTAHRREHASNALPLPVSRR